MSTPKPFVSNEQMKVTGIWGTKSWSPGLTLDQLRDIYEAHVQQLVRERDEALAKVTWISVEDRLPDLPILATDGSRFSETVLVFRSKAPKHTCVGESQYGDYGSGDAGWLGESGQGVTHWMPLPSPPSPSTT